MTLRPEDLLRPTPEGLFCPPGGFHIDPVRAVPRALITHAHSDHARPGHGAVLATPETLALMAARLGRHFAGTTEVAGREPISIGGVTVTFRPAGHVLGSAQIAVEAGGTRIVAAGDYKRAPDPTCAPFEPVPCDVFITEATFGLPLFRHPAPEGEVAKLLASLATFPDRAHLVGVYSLGKAQRLLALLHFAGWERPVFIHDTLAAVCAIYEAAGIALGPLSALRPDRLGGHAGEIVLGPPQSLAAAGLAFADPVRAFASGWMGVARRRQGIELPLVLSDHADWPELTATIAELAPAETWITHGGADALVRWCALGGRAARPLRLAGHGGEGG